MGMENKTQSFAERFHKYFKLDKEYFEAFNAYTSGKLKYNWFKKLLLGILGGVFIGLGYTGYLLMAGLSSTAGDLGPLYLFIGCLLFPTGLLLCIYLGGNLFTSNCMGFISILYKEHKIEHYFMDLGITLIGNAIGCILLALIIWASNVFGTVNSGEFSDTVLYIIELAKKKYNVEHQWWNNFFSGILCNVIIVGTTIISIQTKKSGVGAFVIYLMLVIFIFSGYQHVVANIFLFSIAGWLSFGADAAHSFVAAEAGEIIYTNLIPSMIGNLFGGLAITGCYLMAQSYIHHWKNGTPSTPKN